MNLDELKEKSRQIKAPETNGLPFSGTDVAGFLDAVKQEDAKELEGLRKAKWLWMCAAAIFFLSFLHTFLTDGTAVNAPAVTMRRALGLLYLGLAIAFFAHERRLKRIDYGEPVRIFLAHLERRYRFMSPGMIALSVMITGILGYLAGQYLSDALFRYFAVRESFFGYLGAYLITGGAYTVGMIATRSDWKKGKGVLYNKIRSIRENLDSQEPAESDMERS